MLEVTCRCGSSISVADPRAESYRTCPFCGVPISLAWRMPVAGQDAIEMHCFCGAVMQLPRSAGGQTVVCTSCERFILVPGTDGEAVLELGEGPTGAPEPETCPLCDEPRPRDSEICESCRQAGLEPPSAEEQSQTRLARPALRRRSTVEDRLRPEARTGNRRPVLIALALVLGVVGISYVARGVLRTRERERLVPTGDQAPATQEEVRRRLVAAAPTLLDALQTAALPAVAPDLSRMQWGTRRLVDDESGLTLLACTFSGYSVEGQLVTGHAILSVRPLPGSLDVSRSPPLVLVDAMIETGPGESGGGAPPEGATPSAPRYTVMTVAYHPASGALLPQRLDPPLGGYRVLPARTEPVGIGREPTANELIEIAGRDIVGVIRLLRGQILEEYRAARPGARVMAVTYEPIGSLPGALALVLHCEGEHPARPEEPDSIWCARVEPHGSTEGVTAADASPRVPVELVLREVGPGGKDLAGGGPLARATLHCRVDRSLGVLFLPPAAENDLRERRIWPEID